MDKRLEIFNAISETANSISKSVKEYTDNKYKGRRNLHGGKYRKERRLIKNRQKKVAKRLAFSAAIISAMGAIQVANIISQPIPKFKKGGKVYGNNL